MPTGEYFTDYSDRVGLLRWRTEKIAFVLLVPIPFLIPFVVGGGIRSMLVHIYITIIAVIGLNVITGYAGEIVLAQGAFMAMGGYTVSQTLGYGIGFLPALALGGLFTATVAVIVALPTKRVTGFYVAIFTLVLQFVTEWVLNNPQFAGITGGTQQIVPGEVNLAPGVLSMGGGLPFYYFALIAALLVAVGIMNLSRTSIGRSIRATNTLEDNDLAAGVLGINVFRNKLLAFAIGGFLIGVSGGLWAFDLSFLTPANYTLDLTLEHYLILLVGGLGRTWGVAIGATLIIALQSGLRNMLPLIQEVTGSASIGPITTILFGILIIVVLIFEPDGIVSILGKVKEYLRRWPYAY